MTSMTSIANVCFHVDCLGGTAIWSIDFDSGAGR